MKKTACKALRTWERKEKRRTVTIGKTVITLPPLRKVYFGRGLVAMANGEHSTHATAKTTEEAARGVIHRWKELGS